MVMVFKLESILKARIYRNVWCLSVILGIEKKMYYIGGVFATAEIERENKSGEILFLICFFSAIIEIIRWIRLEYKLLSITDIDNGIK